GLLHREDPLSLRKRRTHVRAEVQDLLDAGPAVQLYPEEPVTATVLCVLDAWPVLLDREPPAHLTAELIWVVALPALDRGPAVEDRLRRQLGRWTAAPVLLGDEPAPDGTDVGLLGQVRHRVTSWAP